MPPNVWIERYLSFFVALATVVAACAPLGCTRHSPAKLAPVEVRLPPGPCDPGGKNDWESRGPALRVYREHVDDAQSPAPAFIAVDCAVGKKDDVPLRKQAIAAAGWAVAQPEQRVKLAVDWLSWSLVLSDTPTYTTCRLVEPARKGAIVTSPETFAAWAVTCMPRWQSQTTPKGMAYLFANCGSELCRGVQVARPAERLWRAFRGLPEADCKSAGAWLDADGAAVARVWAMCEERDGPGREFSDRRRPDKSCDHDDWSCRTIPRVSIRLMEVTLAPDGTPSLPATIWRADLLDPEHDTGPRKPQSMTDPQYFYAESFVDPPARSRILDDATVRRIFGTPGVGHDTDPTPTADPAQHRQNHGQDAGGKSKLGSK